MTAAERHPAQCSDEQPAGGLRSMHRDLRAHFRAKGAEDRKSKRFRNQARTRKNKWITGFLEAVERFGSIAAAAKACGVGRTTIYRRLETGTVSLKVFQLQRKKNIALENSIWARCDKAAKNKIGKLRTKALPAKKI